MASSYELRLPNSPLERARLEVLSPIREAIEFHLDGLREDGLPIPEPFSETEVVEVGAA
jgi:predicted RNase H-like HicB family nuclease